MMRSTLELVDYFNNNYHKTKSPMVTANTNKTPLIKSAQSILLAFFLIMPLSGSITLFAYLAVLQVLFVIACAVIPQGAFNIADNKGITTIVYAWMLSISISWVLLLFNQDAIIQAKLAGSLRQAFIILQVLFFYQVCKLCSINNTLPNKLLYAFCLGCISIFCIHFFVLYRTPSMNSRQWFYTPLLAGHIRDIAILAESASIILLCISIHSKKTLSFITFILALLICLTFVIWSGGRAAMVCVSAIYLIILLYYSYQKRTITKKCLYLALVFIIAWPMAQSLAIFDWNGLERFQNQINTVTTNPNDTSTLTPEALSTGRLSVWKWSLDAFTEKPFFGLGPYGFFFIEARADSGFTPDQPHNILIQSLVEWGTIGTILFFTLLGATFWQSLKLLKTAWRTQNTAFLAAFFTLILLSLRSLTGGAYWNYQSTLCVVLLYAIIFQAIPKLQRAKQSKTAK